MRYTLESITLIEEILKNKLNLQSGEIKSIPVSLNIDDISYRENNQYYFGYINAGDNIDTIDLNLFGLNTIKMDSNYSYKL